jgi:hypothetical protein
MSNDTIAYDDLLKLLDAEAPDLVATILAFAQQPEPYRPDKPSHEMTIYELRSALAQARGARRKKQRQERTLAVLARYKAQPVLAPQLQLADLVMRLYETRTGPARQVLQTLIREAPLTYGLWGGLKRVYKRAEAELDAEVFGWLAARFDADLARGTRADASTGTLRYLSRRTWRFLRQLGKGAPELYPSFAVEILRAYPEWFHVDYTGAGSKIAHHRARKWGGPVDLPSERRFRAPFQEAWKRSPDPLMLLLETCRADRAAYFAINGLRELFPEVLRNVGPEWLARLCYRPLATAHDFVIDTLEGPNYHASELAKLGLHDAVLELLHSPSQRARAYAINYARAHVESLPVELLMKLLESPHGEVTKFAATLLTARAPRDLGLPLVVRMLKIRASMQFARKALYESFDAREFSPDILTDLILWDDQADWVRKFINDRFPNRALPPAFWIAILRNPRLENAYWGTDSFCLEKLGEFPVSSLPAEFVLEALGHDEWSYTVTRWLENADALPPGLDAERVKGLVFDPATRHVAFALLGNEKLFSVDQVEVPYVLALARRADPSLHQWAHTFLLSRVSPERFAPEGSAGDVRAGAARLFHLATAKKEPDAIRSFAQTYLLSHHPVLGPHQTEVRSLGITPLLPREVYTADLVWPTLWDDRPDVRRFGVALARTELRRWNQPERVFELAEAPAKEVRNVAYDALTQAGEANADPDLALSLEQLDPALVFSLTESTIRTTRDVGMALIRRHYARLGGAERLGWLMQSADREVRNYAVRLLWEKHRPTAIPDTWRPPSGRRETPVAFHDQGALRDLLRRLLFAVPPARGGEKGEGRTRRIPAGVAKRRIVEVVRDFGLEDKGFAEMVAPVLGEFTGSLAKGEWQACLSALLTLRRAHGLHIEGLV